MLHKAALNEFGVDISTHCDWHWATSLFDLDFCWV